jgi:hypothetical protein
MIAECKTTVAKVRVNLFFIEGCIDISGLGCGRNGRMMRLPGQESFRQCNSNGQRHLRKFGIVNKTLEYPTF